MGVCKQCSKCKEELLLDRFSLHKSGKYGRRGMCKKCISESNKIYRSNSDVKKREQEYGKARWGNTEKTEELRAQRNKTLREWRARNQESCRLKAQDYKKNKREQDIHFKISENMRNRVRLALKNGKKCGKTMDLVGCSIEQLKNYLESLFQENMSWDNYGLWHIDHIKPCISFDLINPEEQRRCFHYTNLQPLWAEENLKKGGRLLGD